MGRIQAEVEPVPDASGFEWYLDGVLYTGPGMNNSYVSMPIQRNDCSTPDYSIGVKAINPCGTSLGYFELHQNPCYEGGFYYSYFPNPASETLTVERNEQDHSKNGGRNVSIENEATGPHYYRIYDSNSSLLVLEGDLSPKTEIDISKLNKGKYVLKIQIDNDTEETHHIIVD
jgi:hypothetical protein